MPDLDAMPIVWNVITREGHRIEDLTTDHVRELLYRKKLHPEDWAFPSNSQSPAAIDQQLRQLCVIDEFSATASSVRRKRRKAQEPDVEMDMTPMIDVVFLLLIFFMITATFHMQTGLGFPPDSDKGKQSQPTPAPGLSEFDDRLIIEINENDEFFVREGTAAPSQPIDVADLVQEVRKQSNENNLNKAFVVAHELASLEAIVKAFDVAAEVGISDVSLADVTTPPAGASSGPLQIQRN